MGGAADVKEPVEEVAALQRQDLAEPHAGVGEGADHGLGVDRAPAIELGGAAPEPAP